MANLANLAPTPLTPAELAAVAAMPVHDDRNDRRVVSPIPIELRPTKATFARFAPRGMTFTEAYVWRNEAGEALYYTARYDGADCKAVLPFCLVEQNFEVVWVSMAPPGARVLYNLHPLATNPSAPVVVCEGEKTANALSAIFPRHVVVTTMGGAKAAAKSDWSPLRGRHIAVWRDNDQAGREYEADGVRLATAAGAASVCVVQIPEGLPSGWDPADPVPAGVDLDFARMLREATEVGGSTSPTPGVLPAAPEAKHSASWEAPDLSVLGTGRRPAPTFDVDVLGPVWTEWALEQAAAASAPVDYVGCALLAITGATVANVRWPMAGANWAEPPVLWVGEVGSPSAGKSPAMSAAIELVRAAEERMAEGFDDERRAYETAKRVAEAVREGWEDEIKAALKDARTPPPMPATAEAPPEPIRQAIILMDVSTEKQAILAAARLRGQLRTYDELAGWFGSFGRYGGGGSDRAFAIEMYGGRQYLVDRVKAPEPIRIRHLSIGVLGGIQPDKLAEALDGPDDGLPARFLWCWPDTSPTFTLSRERLSNSTAKAAFVRLADLPMGADDFGNPEPVRMPLDRVAEDLIEAFAREVATRAADASGVFAGTLGKARGHVLRLSAVLELLWWSAQPGKAAPTSISREAVGDAIDLVDSYFLPMAERVFGDAAIPLIDRNATALARHLRQSKESSFNARQVRRLIGGPLRDAAAMDAACAALVDAGIIRPIPFAGMGRKPKDFEINPVIFGELP